MPEPTRELESELNLAPPLPAAPLRLALRRNAAAPANNGANAEHFRQGHDKGCAERLWHLRTTRRTSEKLCEGILMKLDGSLCRLRRPEWDGIASAELSTT